MDDRRRDSDPELNRRPKKTMDARNQEAPHGPPPDFFLIGAMKAGTTTLHRHLSQHPQLFSSATKEPGFFSRDERFEAGFDAYRQLFEGAGPDQLCLDASTCYSRQLEFPKAAARAAEYAPDAKLIYLMRHPVDRAYSHYVHLMSRRLYFESSPPISLDEALAEYPTIVDASRYDIQIERYLEFFDRDRVHLLTLDDLRLDVHSTLASLQDFLELDACADWPEAALSANQAGTVMSRLGAKSWLRSRRQTLTWRALRSAVPRGARKWVRDALVSRYADSKTAEGEVDAFRSALSPLTDRQRGKLLRELNEATLWTEAQLGRRLDEWRK